MKLTLEAKHLPRDVYELRVPGEFMDESLVLQLYQGEPQMKITVCLNKLGHLPRNKRHVFIKDWAANEGIKDAMVAAGVVEAPVLEIPVNQYGSKAYECRLTDKTWAIVPEEHRQGWVK